MKEFTVHLFYYDQGMDMYVEEWLKITVTSQGVVVQTVTGDEVFEDMKDLLHDFLSETVRPVLDGLRKRICPWCKTKMRRVFGKRFIYPSETGRFLASQGYDVSATDKTVEKVYKCGRCGLVFKVFQKTIDGGASYQLVYRIFKDGKEASYILSDGMKTEKTFLMADLKFLDGLIKMGLVGEVVRT